MSADAVPFVTLRSTGAGLSDRECYLIARATPGLPGAWHVQYDEDNLGHGSIALVPGKEERGQELPVFLIWREAGRLQLGIGQGDFYATLGIYGDIGVLIRAVRHTIEGTKAGDEWVSCGPGYSAWKFGAAPSLYWQARRPN